MDPAWASAACCADLEDFPVNSSSAWDRLGQRLSANRSLGSAARGALRRSLRYFVAAAGYSELELASAAIREATLAWDAFALGEFGGLMSRAVGFHPECLRQAHAQLYYLRDSMRQGWVPYMVPLCTEKWLSDAVHAFKVSGLFQEAAELFAEASELRYKRVRMVRWRNFTETPSFVLPALDSKPNWTDDPRIEGPSAAFRRHHRAIAAEFERYVAAGHWRENDLFANFKRGKTWQGAILYDCKRGGWQEEECLRLPETCGLLREDADDAGWIATERSWGPVPCVAQERLAVYAVVPGSVVPLHGTTQLIVNIHMGLQGLEGSAISVAGSTTAWRPGGRVFGFQDSFDHEVWHHGNETRYVLVFSMLHPGMPQLVERIRAKKVVV